MLHVTAGVPVTLRCLPGFSRPIATIAYTRTSQTQTYSHIQLSSNTEFLITAKIDNHLDQIYCQAYIPGQKPTAKSVKLSLFVNGKSFLLKSENLYSIFSVILKNLNSAWNTEKNS